MSKAEEYQNRPESLRQSKENLSSAKSPYSGSLKVGKKANVDDFYLKSSNSEIAAFTADNVTIKGKVAIFLQQKTQSYEEIEATTIDIESCQS